MEDIKNMQNLSPRSKEDLIEENTKLKELCEELYERLKVLSQDLMFKRVDYLFNIINYKEVFAAKDVKAAVSEISKWMFPKEESKEVK